MAGLVRYSNFMMDSARWEGFEFRDGDIVISTPPKCGTTWTQMICALLIFGSPEFPEKLDLMSPWFDAITRSRDELFRMLASQTHRRFIKTHTPLDGLPDDPRVTWICVGRDPRDVAISMHNHLDNLDMDVVGALVAEAGDAAQDAPRTPPAPRPESERDRFWAWMESDDLLRGLGATMHHFATFWDVRARPDVLMLHYGEMSDDLPGQMRRVASHLGIRVDEDAFGSLVQAATFEHMRANADTLAPNASRSFWRDNTRFFNSGTTGQWRRVMDEPGDLERYAARAATVAAPDLVEWAHQGPVV